MTCDEAIQKVLTANEGKSYYSTPQFARAMVASLEALGLLDFQEQEIVRVGPMFAGDIGQIFQAVAGVFDQEARNVLANTVVYSRPRGARSACDDGAWDGGWLLGPEGTSIICDVLGKAGFHIYKDR